MGLTRNIFRALCLLIGVITAACQFNEQTQTSTPSPQPGLIGWERSPTSIVFQADVVGGTEDLARMSEVPICTIYGDNRIVWVNELDAFHVEILYDFLTDAAISDFIAYLTVQERIYTHEAYAAEQVSGDIAPVVEVVTISVNGQLHTADAFSGWDSEWFSRVANSCKRISQSPILYEPSGAWLTVATADYNMSVPTVNWDGQSLILADFLSGGQPRWIEGAEMLSLWNYLNTLPSNLIFLQNNAFYRIALQVPGISRTSPPPP
jgi:hypothetical protein